GVEALWDVRAAVVPQALDQTRPLVSRGGDGLGGPQARFHPPQEGPAGTRRVVPTAGGKAPGARAAMRAGAPPPRPDFAPRNPGVGAPPPPAPAALHTRPPRPSPGPP